MGAQLPSPLVEAHPALLAKLRAFCDGGSIPNIMLYGPSGAGKKTLLLQLIHMIYQPPEIRDGVMFVDCANGRGIHFIRDELKTFAKSKLLRNLKSVVMLHIERLTIDAQSALRRCIEFYSANTRFFAVIHNRSKLIKPIQSRFSWMYVPLPTIGGAPTNLHVRRRDADGAYGADDTRLAHVRCVLAGLTEASAVEDAFEAAERLYERGVSGIDVVETIEALERERGGRDDTDACFAYLHGMRRTLRHEKMYMVFVIYMKHIRRTPFAEFVSRY